MIILCELLKEDEKPNHAEKGTKAAIKRVKKSLDRMDAHRSKLARE